MSVNQEIVVSARQLGTLDTRDLSPSLREAISLTTASRFGGSALTDDQKRFMTAAEREERMQHVIAAAPRPLTDPERKEATSALAWYGVASKPMSAQEIEDWLGPAIMALTNVPGGDEMPVVMAAWAFALADVPMVLFTEAAARQVALLPRGYFPTPGQVLELLKPALAAFQDGRDGLARALEVGQSRPAAQGVPLPDLGRTKRQPDEIAAVNRSMSDYLSEVAGRTVGARGDGRGKGPVFGGFSTATLIAMYERQSQSVNITERAAANIRLVALRAKLQVEMGGQP